MSSAEEEPFYPSYNSCDEVSSICPIKATLYGYRPTLGATALFAAIFAINLVITLGLMIHSRLWSFQAWLSVGLIFEVIGYAGRLMMHQDPRNSTTMSMQLACLFIGPSFVSAAISVVFKHIILYCGQQHSKLKAKWYPYVFIGTDFACILVQVAGGAISSIATTGDGSNMALLDAGSGLLIAGVAAQVANMVGCGMIILHFIYNYRRHTRGPTKHEQPDTSQYATDKTDPKMRRNFNGFCWALFVAYIAVLIRCIYRIPEMAMGWGSTLMQNETSFLILDGAMIAIAVTLLTLAYPGIWFPPMRRNKKQASRSMQNTGTLSLSTARNHTSYHKDPS